MGPIRPIVAATDEMASSSGTPAAASAPKAMTRMISVTGSEVISAFLKSSSNDLEMALSALASPNWAMRRSGWAFWAAAVAARTASIFSSASSSSPGIFRFTRTALRFLAMAASLR